MLCAMLRVAISIRQNQATDQLTSIEFIFGRRAKGQRMLGLHGGHPEQKSFQMRFNARRKLGMHCVLKRYTGSQFFATQYRAKSGGIRKVIGGR
jgi:hypothetical protein